MVRTVAAILLMCVMTLTGVGRGMALASTTAEAAVSIAGVAVPICHTTRGDGSEAPDRAQHDCCESCVLLAPTILPAPPDLTAPAAVAYFATHAHAVAWVPLIARLRTPRQSQGPPTG